MGRRENLNSVHQFVMGCGLRVCDVWGALVRYYSEVVEGEREGGERRRKLHDFICELFRNKKSGDIVSGGDVTGDCVTGDNMTGDSVTGGSQTLEYSVDA